MDKITFEAPVMEIVEFETSDVITSSGPEPEPPQLGNTNCFKWRQTDISELTPFLQGHIKKEGKL